MKKLSILSLLCLFLVQLGYSQAVPQGMKYQAVARDLSGEVLGNQEISLRVNLYTRTDRFATTYSETHAVTTNQLGLFTLTIGEGNVESGKFSKVPWTSSDIWMEIAIKEREDSDFSIISTSKMLSVPYAFHAATASELVDFGTGNLNRGSTPGVNSQNWSLFGNSKSDPADDKLGTTDMADLVIVTNNVERMRVFTDGDIEILNSLTVDNDFTVKYNVALNTDGGATINYGPLTVENVSPTLLSGTLTVDQATDLNSSLNVDGPTDLNSSLSVNNMSPTILSGTLLTEGDATFNEHVFIDNPAYNSTLITNGALVVDGGVGIGLNLNVGGDARFEGNVEINGPLALTDASPSTNPTSGALTVVGGVGIGENLNVGGITKFGTGSFTPANYPLIIQGSGQGIAIKVTGSRSGANNFVSFHDDNGRWGAIQGQTPGELWTDPEYLVDLGFQTANLLITGTEILIAGSDEIMAIADLVQAGVDLAAASTAVTVCANAGGPCVAPPALSNIAAKVVDVVLKTVNLVAVSANLGLSVINGGLAIGEEAAYIAFKNVNIGVTYSSGSGDYAEWLPKANPNLKFFPGDIVGVKSGFVSKTTAGAEYVMVISDRPIVLGNNPPQGKERDYEKVAFMGQVPVKVFGRVNIGDYIIPSGFNNGFGIAVAPNEMRASDYQRIVGIAWTGSNSDNLSYVNVAVGLNANDVTKLVIAQGDRLETQEKEMQQLKLQVYQISELITDMASGASSTQISARLEAITDSPPVGSAIAPVGISISSTEEITIVYLEVTREQISESLELAENLMIDQGVNMESREFFRKLNADPSSRERFVSEIKSFVESAMIKQAEIDRASGATVEFAFTPESQSTQMKIPSLIVEMGYELAKIRLKNTGIDIEEHPFFKNLSSDPVLKKQYINEINQLLNDAAEN